MLLEKQIQTHGFCKMCGLEQLQEMRGEVGDEPVPAVFFGFGPLLVDPLRGSTLLSFTIIP
jgi:hypothetical protein